MKMPRATAYASADVNRISITEDGELAILWFAPRAIEPSRGPAPEVPIAIPTTALLDLVALISGALGESKKRREKNPAAKHAWPVDWWEIRSFKDNSGVIFSFRLPGGLELSFQIQRKAAERYLEGLESTLRGINPVPPDTARH